MQGNLTADPDLKFTPNGASVTSFTVASNASKKNASGQWEVTDTTFLNCTVWGQTAEQVAESLRKGSSVVVVGKLKQSSYLNKEGKKVYSFDVVVDSVGLDIRKAHKDLGQPVAAVEPVDPWANSSQTNDAPF